jgi:hypothetical protein
LLDNQDKPCAGLALGDYRELRRLDPRPDRATTVERLLLFDPIAVPEQIPAPVVGEWTERRSA